MRRSVGAVGVAFVLALLACPTAAAQPDGRALFLQGCANCHGDDARGRPGTAPSLTRAGAQAADFYLETGRMPLDAPHDEPVRSPPAYTRAQRRALVDYIAALGGPPVPAVHPERGSLAEGQELFTSHCAGCHQAVARGGIVPGAVAPPLVKATPRQIAEAVRIGPYLMPAFPERQIDAHQLDSIARYVLSTRTPPDRGGWGLGNLGPIPEGMVAWLLAGAVLLLIVRLLGERTEP
jgi:ubiquinol-cytochrome c reductase cytochrome c subunit